MGYYAKRERQERELAASSTDPSIKMIHQELAERYAKLADIGAGAPVRPKLSIAQPG